MQAFTVAEREILRGKLLSAAQRLFAQQGYTATTVGQLARAASIGKGSFYLLFSSKEELLWALHAQLHESFDKQMAEILNNLSNAPADTVYRFICAVFDLLANPLVVRLQASGDFDRIMRMRTPEQVEEDKQLSLRPLVAAIEQAQAVGVLIAGDPHIIAGAIRSICLLALHQEEIGSKEFPQVADLVIQLVAKGLVKQPDTFTEALT